MRAGYDLYFRMNYTFCIIHIHYETVHSIFYLSGKYETKQLMVKSFS